MVHDEVMERVEKLEKTVAALSGLPDEVFQVRGRGSAVELQIVQLRSEMKDGFSAVRRDVSELATEMRVLHEDVIERIARLGER